MKKINLLPVRKSLATAAAGATFLAFSVSALASNFTIEFFANNPKLIELTIDTVDRRTGNFSGEATGQKQELYEVAGTIKNGKVEIELTNIQKEERIVASGKIQNDGVIAGRAATEDGELFEWEATDALVGSKTS